ncbi:MAG: lycopene cyclase domain-containing protein [Flavobacteriaceae bacterium]
MKPYTYLLVNFTCFIIPFLASFYPKHAFYKSWKPFFKGSSIVALVFVVWDYFFTKFGIWGFNSEYLTGNYMGNLPIEEILFFFCIPYACVFTYFAFQYLIIKNPLEKIQNIITNILIIFLLLIAIINLGKLYTSITFFSTALFLIFVWYNDTENLGIRFFNIPVEDSIYGMLLVFLNIELYEYFKRVDEKT